MYWLKIKGDINKIFDLLKVRYGIETECDTSFYKNRIIIILFPILK